LQAILNAEIPRVRQGGVPSPYLYSAFVDELIMTYVDVKVKIPERKTVKLHNNKN